MALPQKLTHVIVLPLYNTIKFLYDGHKDTPMYTNEGEIWGVFLCL